MAQTKTRHFLRVHDDGEEVLVASEVHLKSDPRIVFNNLVSQIASLEQSNSTFLLGILHSKMQTSGVVGL